MSGTADNKLPRSYETPFERDVVEYLGNLPTVERKTFETRADWPQRVRLRTASPWGVTCVHAYERDDPSATVTPTGVSWSKRDDGGQGVVIENIGGLTTGTDYVVTLRIDGGA